MEEYKLNIPETFLKYYETGVNSITKVPAEVLRKPCNDVAFITLHTRQLINKMIKAMKEAKGVGLSAPQVGVSQNIIVVDASKPFELINPRVLGYSGPYMEAEEGCLSIPGLYGYVRRFEIVHVAFLNKDKKAFNMSFDGMVSRIIQHEIDHLNGILFVDRVESDSLKWKHLE